MNEIKVIENGSEVVPYGVRGRISPMRKVYILKFVGRCIVLLFFLWMGLKHPEQFEVLQDFTGGLHALHVIWFVWMVDMLLQIFYVKGYVPLGSQKLFRQRYIPVKGRFDGDALRDYIRRRTRSAYQVFVIYALGIAALGLLKKAGILNDMWLLVICGFFYVCDLICVLIWCPFRIFMKTRCCTECRIFNWDHLMMFSPLLFVDGFYAKSLLWTAVAVFLLWEYRIMVYPERFWEGSNEALQCTSCTDKLCSQYCGKKRYE